MKKITSSQFLLALILLISGSVLLLVNLNLISLEIKKMFSMVYPFLLLLLALFWLIQWTSQTKKSGKLFWGLFFLIFSGFLIADRLDYIDFGFWDFWKLWPFVLIYFAFRILIDKKPVVKVQYHDFSDHKDKVVILNGVEKKEYTVDKDIIDEVGEDIIENLGNTWATVEGDIKTIIDEVMNQLDDKLTNDKVRSIVKDSLEKSLSKDAIKKSVKKSILIKRGGGSNAQVNVLGMKVSDVEFNTPNWSLEPMHLESAFVKYFFDFSKAFIPEGETPVVLKGRMGDIEVLIPEDLPVKISVQNSIGDVTIFENSYPTVSSGSEYYYESPNYDEATRKVKLEIKLSIGSVQIDKV